MKNHSNLIAIFSRTALLGVGMAMVFLGTASPALAWHQTPEVDPGSIGNAMALLTGGAFILSSRLQKK